jgi:hypothetical protein
MGPGLPCGFNLAKPCRRARAELGGEVQPLVFELPTCDRKLLDCANPIDFFFVEVISAANRLCVNRTKVNPNVDCRRRRPEKSRELRVIPVAARPAGKHCLGEQSFTPQRHQALWVKVFRVQRPQTHLYFCVLGEDHGFLFLNDENRGLSELFAGSAR